MNNSVANLVSIKLDALRNELIDLAVDFDRRQRPEASDVAMATAARLRELCDELSGADTGSSVE